MFRVALMAAVAYALSQWLGTFILRRPQPMADPLLIATDDAIRSAGRPVAAEPA